jgi:hypothetical protein
LMPMSRFDGVATTITWRGGYRIRNVLSWRAAAQRDGRGGY